MDADLDAKGEWTAPKSRIEERQRVIRDLRQGYVIVPRIHAETIRRGMLDQEIRTTAPITRALRAVVDDLDFEGRDTNETEGSA